MRTNALLCVSIVLASTAGCDFGRADPDADKEQARIAVLVVQLGDKDYAKREAATKELGDIGEPARATQVIDEVLAGRKPPPGRL